MHRAATALLIGLTAAGLGAAGLVRAEPAPATESGRPGGAANTLTDREKADGWVLLFDGRTTSGWRLLGGGEFPLNVWGVRDGCLVRLPGAGSGRDIIYERAVEDFELTWEWRVPRAGGNSGVKYRVPESPGKRGAFGPEYQMMADGEKADKHATGSLYDVLPPADKRLAPAGAFNVSRIVVRGNKAEHWLNGRRTVAFEFWTEDFKRAVGESKFKDSPVWGRTPKGYIALTDHEDEAEFRNIKLKAKQ